VYPRVIAVSVLALLASLQVIRTAVVSATVERNPAIAERVWSSHPHVSFALAMAEIGDAAVAGKSALPESALRRSERASNRAPLAIEPFLIKGAASQTEGRNDFAERLFVEARRRDPRSAAARYFLAERYLVTGRVAAGLNEFLALARLVPGGSQLIVPGLAQYARTPDAFAHLRTMFAANPEIGQAVLAELASDAGNADLILRIAGPRLTGTPGAPVPAWQVRLLDSLVQRGEFARAQTFWSGISGIRPSNPPGLLNKSFAKIDAPPPFNWTFGSGSFGVAEPVAGGQLKVIYYGRENAQLASQLLLLRPGQYRIVMEASGDAGGTSDLEWSIVCEPSKAKIAGVPLGAATLAGKEIGATFAVPARNCPAQWLKLTGTPRDIAKLEQATIGKLELLPVNR
jgi:tetratricopeptide (TPR) repeat protein